MSLCFFFNDTATTEIYTLSLHDALPISVDAGHQQPCGEAVLRCQRLAAHLPRQHHVRVDRKSTRLNSSHANISYAVFCLKKKKLARCVYEPSNALISRCVTPRTSSLNCA